MDEFALAFLIVWAIGALCWVIVAACAHGIYEHNLLRTLAKCATAPIWPSVGVYYIARGVNRYARTRFYSDLQELTPKTKAPAVTPPRVTVADLAANEGTSYKPGQWIN